MCGSICSLQYVFIDCEDDQEGMRAHIGAHGEPPLGLNYHAEMFFASQGGLNNYEVNEYLLFLDYMGADL